MNVVPVVFVILIPFPSHIQTNHIIYFSIFFIPPFSKDVTAVEFQKRGLPHVHLLVWLDNEYKCKTPEDIDSIISSKLPSQLLDPLGYEVVSQLMMHGPCGVANPSCTCMKDNKCSKYFPKKYRSETVKTLLVL